LTFLIELAVGNIVRRVLKIIREVARGELNNADRENSNESSEEYSSNEDSDFSADEKTTTKSNIKVTAAAHPHSPSLLSQSSMFNLLSDGHAKHNNSDGSTNQQIKNTYNLKPLIIQEINEEIIADLESVYKGIADQATDFIHAKYVFQL
jgi:translation initiation factor eIF-2B subunit beta